MSEVLESSDTCEIEKLWKYQAINPITLKDMWGVELSIVSGQSVTVIDFRNDMVHFSCIDERENLDKIFEIAAWEFHENFKDFQKSQKPWDEMWAHTRSTVMEVFSIINIYE